MGLMVCNSAQCLVLVQMVQIQVQVLKVYNLDWNRVQIQRVVVLMVQIRVRIPMVYN